jgi:2-polyprenyl-3-methyl-5-hydroxy-6-metoxy-1,4-benzoquinol methylase
MIDYQKIYNENYFKGKNSFFYKLGYGWNPLSFKLRYREIRKNIPLFPGARILDIGCAFGFLLKEFPEEFEIYGLDVSEYAISKAREKNPRAIFQIADITKEKPFPDGFFDLIIMNDIIEHLETPETAIKNTRLMLKKKGYLYLTTPNLNFLRKTFFYFPDKWEHHISLKHFKETKNLLESSNLKIINSWTFITIFGVRIKVPFSLGLEAAFICQKL